MKYDQFTKNMPWMMPMVNPEHIQQLQTEFTENFRQLMLQTSLGSLQQKRRKISCVFFVLLMYLVEEVLFLEEHMKMRL